MAPGRTQVNDGCLHQSYVMKGVVKTVRLSAWYELKIKVLDGIYFPIIYHDFVV